MSIASEITALNTNLTAAKNAIVTKGGTVGNTGLAGLGNEILGIPAGGSTPAVPEPPSGAYVAFSAYAPEFVVDYVESADPSATLVSFTRRDDPFNLVWISDPDFALNAIFEDSPLNGEPYNLTLRWIDMDRMFRLIFKDSSEEEHVATEFYEWDIDSYGIQFSNTNFMNGGADIDLAYIRMGLDFTSTVDNISITDPAEFATFMEPTTSSWESYESGSTIYNLMRAGGQLVQKQFITDINFGTLAQSLSTIDAGFFTNTAMLKTMYNLPDSVTSIGASFLSGCQNFNSYFEIPSNATIGSGFLSGCTAFNQPITIPSGVTLSTAADYNFMYDCYSMTSTVTVNAPATAIGASNYILSTSNSSAKCYTQGILLEGNYKTEWKAKLPDRTSSPYRKFLPSAVIGPANAKVYVGYTTQLSITFQPNTQDHSGIWSSSDTSIATVDQTGLVTGVSAGNATITFQSVNGYSVSMSINSSVPVAAIELSNGKTTFARTLVEFGRLSRSSISQTSWTDTIDGVTVSNSTITKVRVFSTNVTQIGNNFLPYCANLTQLELPSTVTSVGNYFLYNCTSFNQPIDLSNITTIGNYFLSGCASFNQNLVVPSTMASIGSYFLYSCDRMTGTITCNADASIIPASDYTMATESVQATMYTTGVTLVGPNAQLWRAKFYNRTVSPYRKTIADMDVPVNSLVMLDGTVVALTNDNVNQLGDPSGQWSTTIDGVTITPNSIYGIDISGLTVETLQRGFLYGATYLRKVVLNEGLKTIEGLFMRGCSRFDSTLVVPSTITTIGAQTAGTWECSFMYECPRLIGVVCNCAFPEFPNPYITEDETTLGVYYTSAQSFVDGVLLSGPYAQNWKSYFPDRLSGSRPYRKLIVAS